MRLPVQVGAIVNKKYRIDRLIGEGGMGVVFSARHLELDEHVALKFLRGEAMADPDLVARFSREARAAVSIKSEHVARILDVGTVDGDGAPFIVMEYLEGMDVGSALQRHGVFPVADVAEYGLHVCEALAMAHAKGIVHRDIKPENLFLTTTPHTTHIKVVKVLDFGISKAALTGQAFGEVPLVRTVHLMGTPLYMSPEQIRASANVDARSDIWSLGMVLYEMLTGMTAFNAASLTELCAAILERDIAPLTQHRLDVPEGLARVVARCLQRDPAQRFQHVGALANGLLPFAPKRARICAERAVSVLHTAGIAERELHVHSSFPPAPTDGSGEMSAEFASQIRATPPVPSFRGASESVATQAPLRPLRRTRLGLIAPAAAFAVPVVIAVVVAMRYTSRVDAVAAAPPVAEPAAMVAEPAPVGAHSATVLEGRGGERGEPSGPAASTTVGASTQPGASADPRLWVRPAAPLRPPKGPLGAASGTSAPRVGAAGSAAAPDPKSTAMPPSKFEEGPDLGY
jgi:serine/threonine-protein kinase